MMMMMMCGCGCVRFHVSSSSSLHSKFEIEIFPTKAKLILTAPKSSLTSGRQVEPGQQTAEADEMGKKGKEPEEPQVRPWACTEDDGDVEAECGDEGYTNYNDKV